MRNQNEVLSRILMRPYLIAALTIAGMAVTLAHVAGVF